MIRVTVSREGMTGQCTWNRAGRRGTGEGEDISGNGVKGYNQSPYLLFLSSSPPLFSCFIASLLSERGDLEFGIWNGCHRFFLLKRQMRGRDRKGYMYIDDDGGRAD